MIVRFHFDVELDHGDQCPPICDDLRDRYGVGENIWYEVVEGAWYEED